MSNPHNVDYVEVTPDTKNGGWRVDIHYENSDTHGSRSLGYYRFKRTAKKQARELAQQWKVEMRVKNKKGQYTSEAASYGNDPRRSKG